MARSVTLLIAAVTFVLLLVFAWTPGAIVRNSRAMKRIRQAIRTLRRELRAWGTEPPKARATTGSATVQIYVMTRDGKKVIGTLWKDGNEFVFRYDPKFVRSEGAKPISAFPDLDEEYRREDLWPFFAVRLPPVDREDVRRVLKERHIPESDVLRLLGEVSGRGVSSPYRFALDSAG